MTSKEAVKAYRRRLVLLLHPKHFYQRSVKEPIPGKTLCDIRIYMTQKDSMICLNLFDSHR